MHQILLCALLVHSAWGQGAPGDFDLNDCTVPSVNEEVVLFDSRAYRMAYTTNWIFMSYDANTDVRWTQQGGLCTATLATGTSTVTGENNWAISQFINYLDAREVIIDINYLVLSGGSVTVYMASSNGEFTDSQRRDRSLYAPVNGTAEMSRFIVGTNLDTVMLKWGFSRPPNRKGFYLAFQDIDSRVISITSLRVYYRIALPRTDGLLSCPAVPLSSLGSTAVGTCSCAANSGPVASVSLETTCNYTGVCSGGQWCECYSGYNLNGNQCDACPEGTYKHLHSNSSCLSCPINSESRGTNNSVCGCIPPNIRDSSDPTAPCTTPASSPRLILGSGGLPVVNGDMITVCWLPSLNKGGLDDLRYNLYVFSTDVQSPTFRRLNPPEGVVQEDGDDTTNVCYAARIAGFGINYGMIVVATNGATASIDGEVITDAELVQGRSVAFFVAGSPASSCSSAASVGGPVLATLIMTAIVVGAVSANTSFNMSDNSSYSSKPRPPLVHEADSEKLESYPSSRKVLPYKPVIHSCLPPPKPAPRHV